MNFVLLYQPRKEKMNTHSSSAMANILILPRNEKIDTHIRYTTYDNRLIKMIHTVLSEAQNNGATTKKKIEKVLFFFV